MNRDNQLLVTNEPVEFRDFKKFKDHFRGILENIPLINIEKPKDVNM
jgi:hypothetical protein